MISTLLQEPGTIVVDVRTPAEFESGHVENSINIPLQDLPVHLDELRGIKHVVLCCASGARSMRACIYLRQNGIECSDGGSWLNIKR